MEKRFKFLFLFTVIPVVIFPLSLFSGSDPNGKKFLETYIFLQVIEKRAKEVDPNIVLKMMEKVDPNIVLMIIEKEAIELDPNIVLKMIEKGAIDINQNNIGEFLEEMAKRKEERQEEHEQYLKEVDKRLKELKGKWKTVLVEAIKDADKIEIKSSFFNQQDKLFHTIKGNDKIQEFINILDIDEPKSSFYCACHGSARLVFSKENTILVTLSYHHNQSLRWYEGPWVGDALLTKKSKEQLPGWFESQGYSDFADIDRQILAEKKEAEQFMKYFPEEEQKKELNSSIENPIKDKLKELDEKTKKLAHTYTKIWKDPGLRKHHLSVLHKQNPEWNFMFRTYSVLAFTNLALSNPETEKEYLSIIDLIIEDTLELEQKHSFKYFLLEYGQGDNWESHPPRSQFIDGEIAIMLASRCIIAKNKKYSEKLKDRVDIMVKRMKKSPVLCAESYPNECWVFCNTISLAAIKLSDQINNTDHSKFISKWIDYAQKNLLDSKTGLLRSAFTLEGKPVESARGPEGSSIWMACHMLQVVDEDFAQNQYQLACKELLDEFLGFGYSREWPLNHHEEADIDSGSVVPFLQASPSASGLAILCTASFKDKNKFDKLTMSLNTFAFPIEDDESLYYQLSNPLGDTVLLYGFTVGPILEQAD
ncbi:MAG: linalool dehydratase/isomerase domain-containing protein [Planctomycetota bacterium]|jgi:cellobiose-specific phosphotransferase system component IIA